MICTSCGKENKEGNRFCTHCGSPIAAAQPACAPVYCPVPPAAPPVYYPPQPVQGYAPAPMYAPPVQGYAPTYVPPISEQGYAPAPMYAPVPMYQPVPEAAFINNIPLQSEAPPASEEKGNPWVPIVAMSIMALIGVGAFVASLFA